MERKTLAVRILAVIALVSTALAAIGWVVFLGGFGFLANRSHCIPWMYLTTEVFCICVYSLDQDLKALTAFRPCTTGQDHSDITGHCWDPYWVVSVLSPILFILLIVKAILLIIKDELFRKFFVIHILAVIAFIITVITLCFMGHVMERIRVIIQVINTPTSRTSNSVTVPGYINALFAGVLLETMFLTVAWICHILAFLFGGMMESQKE